MRMNVSATATTHTKIAIRTTSLPRTRSRGLDRFSFRKEYAVSASSMATESHSVYVYEIDRLSDRNASVRTRPQRIHFSADAGAASFWSPFFNPSMALNDNCNG